MHTEGNSGGVDRDYKRFKSEPPIGREIQDESRFS